jgi:hypothetical protein
MLFLTLSHISQQDYPLFSASREEPAIWSLDSYLSFTLYRDAIAWWWWFYLSISFKAFKCGSSPVKTTMDYT